MPTTKTIALLALLLSGDHRAVRLWRVTLALLLCAVTYLALIPAPPPQVSLGWDKLNHFSAFATLAGLAFLSFAGAWLRIAVALLSYGALIEVLQSFTPTRTAEWGDLLADALGIAFGLLLSARVVATASRRGRRRQ